MPRIIGIRHQEKATVGGEIRPTQLCIIDGDEKPVIVELSDITEELDWIVGKHPTKWRDVSDVSEDVSAHVGYIKFGPLNVKEGETLEGRHPSQVQEQKGKVKLARQVPSGYDGVRLDDVYIAMMGGSGHQLMASISAQLQKLGGTGTAYQIPPNRIADNFGKDRDKDDDAKRLITVFGSDRNLFYEVKVQDQRIAQVKSTWNLRQAAQYARIAHGLRLRKVALMAAYANPDLYVGAGLEVETLKLIAGDEDMVDLKSDEGSATLALRNAVEDTDVWQMILSKVEGIGPAIAGGLIAAIVDIRRFHTPGQVAQYCGVGVDRRPDGSCTIQRRRSGQFSGWNNSARKCLWNFAEQCNKRPSSDWGQHLLKWKGRLLEKHLTPVQSTNEKGELRFSSAGKPIMRYTKGHIHKLAIWKLQTDFICWLWREWGRMHRYGAPKDFRPPGNRGTDIITPDLAEGASSGSAPSQDAVPAESAVPNESSAEAPVESPEAESVGV